MPTKIIFLCYCERLFVFCVCFSELYSIFVEIFKNRLCAAVFCVGENSFPRGGMIVEIFILYKTMLNIVIFGAPGSGKGTQSERILEKYGINHISTGDVLRAEIKAETELGKTAKGFIDQGQLIPDSLMIDILAAKLDGFVDSKGVIFDGFPRTIAQAEALKVMLGERGQDVTVMLELDVPEEELMERLIKRGIESGRTDDNEETIKKRLAVYHNQTSPLKEWYKNDGKHCYINGSGALDRIFADIVAAIESKK